MKLYEQPFNMIKSGEKNIEYRLYDERRKKVQIGDIIRFIKLPNKDDEIFVLVEQIEIFDSFYNMYNKYFEIDFKNEYSSVEKVIQETYDSYYSKEDEIKYGCIAIKIKKLY